MNRPGAAAWGALVSGVLLTAAPCLAGGVYFVKDGDSLAKISRVFGVNVESLRRTNHIAGADVKPGDRVRIPDHPLPPRPPLESVVRHRETAPERVREAVCREEKVYHAVAKGDTLSSISRRYAVELDDLLLLNGVRANAKLAIGRKILVRRSGPRTHTVGRGDTLFSIARASGVTVDEIARLNGLEGNRITAGQRLVLEPCDPYEAAGSVPPPLAGPPAEIPPIFDEPEPSAEVSQRVIDLARTMLNIPYRFGGTTLRGIDCSAYVQRVFGLLEIKLPRTAREQYDLGSAVGRDDLVTGDLVFFRTYASFPSHVGIYLGDNLFIHASSMLRKVTIDSIDEAYYRKRFLGGRRLPLDESPTLAAVP